MIFRTSPFGGIPIPSMVMVYLATWMVAFYGFHVGKYTSPMDGSGSHVFSFPGAPAHLGTLNKTEGRIRASVMTGSSFAKPDQGGFRGKRWIGSIPPNLRKYCPIGIQSYLLRWMVFSRYGFWDPHTLSRRRLDVYAEVWHVPLKRNGIRYENGEDILDSTDVGVDLEISWSWYENSRDHAG